jgi:hypothetical protein
VCAGGLQRYTANGPPPGTRPADAPADSRLPMARAACGTRWLGSSLVRYLAGRPGSGLAGPRSQPALPARVRGGNGSAGAGLSNLRGLRSVPRRGETRTSLDDWQGVCFSGRVARIGRVYPRRCSRGGPPGSSGESGVRSVIECMAYRSVDVRTGGPLSPCPGVSRSEALPQ